MSWKDNIHLYSDEYKSTLLHKISEIVQGKHSGITYKDFSSIDVFHPSGHLGISKLFEDYLSLRGGKVLDVGSGIGGTSRFIAGEYGCSVLGLDYLPQFVEVGELIIQHTGQTDSVRLEQADLYKYVPAENDFDLAVAVTFFLIVSGEDVLRRINRALRIGGLLYVEDYFFPTYYYSLSEEEKALVDSFSIRGTRTTGTMLRQLENTGFEIVEVLDFSEEWSEAAWKKSETMLGRLEGGEDLTEKEIQIYVRTAPVILNHLKHRTVEELWNLYPKTMREIDGEAVRAKPPVLGAKRLIARKLQDVEIQGE